MLSLLPLFSLEEGYLTPLEKARNNRQLIDFFQEFLDEFTDLIHISITQSVPGMVHEIRILREHALSNFPGVPFSEHPIGLSLATMFGPRCMGIFAIETPESK
jgi:fatty acid-binding protein DegV